MLCSTPFFSSPMALAVHAPVCSTSTGLPGRHRFIGTMVNCMLPPPCTKITAYSSGIASSLRRFCFRGGVDGLEFRRAVAKSPSRTCRCRDNPATLPGRVPAQAAATPRARVEIESALRRRVWCSCAHGWNGLSIKICGASVGATPQDALGAGSGPPHSISDNGRGQWPVLSGQRGRR